MGKTISVYCCLEKGAFHCISCLKRSNKLLVSNLMIKRFFERGVRRPGLTRLIVTTGVFDVERIKGKAGKACFVKTFGFSFHGVFVLMFIDYLKTWFRGPLGLKMVLREIGISKIDSVGFTRETSTDAGLDLVLGDYLKKWSSFNWYLSNAYTMEINYSHETALFDRLAFDLDNPKALWEAITGGLRFAQRIEGSFNAKALVVESGFKGFLCSVHVVVS